MKKLNLIIVIVIACFNLKAQDTLVAKTKSEFYRIINSGYSTDFYKINTGLSQKIDSIYHEFDFSSQIYQCQYMIAFILDVDSCGNIINSSPAENNRSHNQLIDFEVEVNKLLINSRLKIKNKVETSDTTYLFNKALVGFEISCYPDELIYNNGMELLSKPIPVIYRNKQEFLIFEDFMFGCN